MLLSEDSELHLLVVQYGGSKDTAQAPQSSESDK